MIEKEEIINDLNHALYMQTILYETMKGDKDVDPNKFDARLLSIRRPDKDTEGGWKTFAEVRWKNKDILYFIIYDNNKAWEQTIKEPADITSFFDGAANAISKLSEQLDIRLHKLGD